MGLLRTKNLDEEYSKILDDLGVDLNNGKDDKKDVKEKKEDKEK